MYKCKCTYHFFVSFGPLKTHHKPHLLTSAWPQAIDDFESHLGEATEKCERNRGKYERLARTLGLQRSGIDPPVMTTWWIIPLSK